MCTSIHVWSRQMADALHLVRNDERPAGRSGSRFLAALPAASRARLEMELEPVELHARTPLWEPNVPIKSVYFPHNCAMSIIVPLRGHVSVEAGTVGREGFLGVPILLGCEVTGTQAIVQVSGMASRLPVSAFRRAVADDVELRDFCLRYTQALLEMTSQSVACNGRHDLSERCARWMLMTRDRLDGDE